MNFNQILKEAVQQNASDLHALIGQPPAFRINGNIVRSGHPIVTSQDVREFLEKTLTSTQWESLQKKLALCFSHFVADVGRFRATVYYHRNKAELSFRMIWPKIPGRESLGLPLVVEDLARRHHGLVIVTGPTGVGKTTTLNYMIDLINRERSSKIVMIEDPIEYEHQSAKSLVVQQEIPSDAPSFHAALIHALRQDPDVICIGEMRDLETIATALTAAETGHLVLTTLHTPNALQTIDRIVGAFPGDQRTFISHQFAGALEGIVSQMLLPRANNQGRVVACEVILGNDAVKNLIRDGKTHQIPSIVQTGAKQGMQLMDQTLKELFNNGTISHETYARATRKQTDSAPVLTGASLGASRVETS